MSPTAPTAAETSLEAELKELAYVVSHDLRQPLRANLHHLELLERKYAEPLPESAREHLDHALAATRRGLAMIDGLLTYSRLNTQAEPHRPVSLLAALQRAMRDVQPQIQAADAIVNAANDLPTVLGDERQLHLLFAELIANAVTFRRDEQPILLIDCQREGDLYRITFKDNGIGFRQADAERIFGLFRTLHPIGEYPGVGMGLAIVRRIVALHGGTIEASSETDHGALFTLRLPVPADDALAAAPPPKVRIIRR